jgi:hypothetical protein
LDQKKLKKAPLSQTFPSRRVDIPPFLRGWWSELSGEMICTKLQTEEPRDEMVELRVLVAKCEVATRLK